MIWPLLSRMQLLLALTLMSLCTGSRCEYCTVCLLHSILRNKLPETSSDTRKKHVSKRLSKQGLKRGQVRGQLPLGTLKTLKPQYAKAGAHLHPTGLAFDASFSTFHVPCAGDLGFEASGTLNADKGCFDAWT